ncbi:MAG: (2Fe-2S)-binding protein [Acidobacteria bacterium]|nr:(2Fe-2S)-binding protein [Acidobacteriota bacterium]
MSTDPEKPTEQESDVTRREFLGTAGAALVVAAAVPGVAVEGQTARPAGTPSRPRTQIRLTVNGAQRRLEVDDHWTLAEMLRDHLRLTGTKLGCERGECGACTVILDGKTVYSCSYLAVWADGKSVTTVEGLAKNGALDPLQQAFVVHDAPQCGFCTSGQLMSAKALLSANPAPTVAEVHAALAGNLCRCSNYSRIAEAVVAAGAAGATRRTSGGGQ